MDKKRPVAIILIACIMLSGCVGGSSDDLTTTTYFCTDGGELYLHSDGRFHVCTSYDVTNGNYTIVRDMLFLDLGSLGFSCKLVLNETDYIDSEGDRWELQIF